MISLEELLNAPLLPENLPKFEIIKECQKVEEPSSDLSDESDSESSEESEIEEVFPCDCGFDEHSSNYDGQACGPPANCINRELFIECNGDECPCRERCQNRRFQKRQYANVKVVETPGKGFGLFTCEDLKPGTLVMEYVGEIITQEEMNRRALKYSAQGQPHFYFMTLRPNQIIDATCKGNLSRFLNHSCSPNCETQKWIVGGKIKIGLFTLKSVKAGSELTFDYKFVRFGKEPQKCLCGEPNCTGFIGVSETSEKSRNIRKKQQQVEEIEVVDDFEVFIESDPKFAELPSEISIIVTKLIQTNDPELIRKLLKILEATEKYLCKRKLLNLHGLKLLATLFTEHLKDSEIVGSILNILAGLPISTRNSIEDSGWFEKLKMVQNDPKFGSIVKDLADKWEKLELTFKIPKKSETREKSGQATPNDLTPSVLMSVPSEFSSALKRKRQWSLEDAEEKIERSESRSISRSRSPAKKIPDPMWLSAKAPDGKTYYYHSVTRETSWEVPLIEAREAGESGYEANRHRERSHGGGYEQRGRDRERNRDDKQPQYRRQYENSRDTKYRDERSRDYKDSRDYRDSKDHRDFRDYKESRESRDSSLRDGNSNNYSELQGKPNSALLEGVGDSSQIAAIIERAKARRSQAEDGEVETIVNDFNSKTIVEGETSPFRSGSPANSRSSDSSSKKYYAKLKEEVSGVVIRFFSYYRNELGDEFKEIARKYTHKIIEKESKEERNSDYSAGDSSVLTSKKKQKIKIYLAEVIKGRKIKLVPEHNF